MLLGLINREVDEPWPGPSRPEPYQNQRQLESIGIRIDVGQPGGNRS
jgi:hypothetical protein